MAEETPRAYPRGSRELIPIPQLEDRHVYVLNSRNLSAGVWVAERGVFIGIRVKFDLAYLFAEVGRDRERTDGTAWAVELTGKVLPDHIRLNEWQEFPNENTALMEFLEPINDQANSDWHEDFNTNSRPGDDLR
jgi:hypothetical protein